MSAPHPDRRQVWANAVRLTVRQQGAMNLGSARGVQACVDLMEAVYDGAGRRLREAAIALARSERGVMSGRPEDFDEWPQMDALAALLDELEPGWREAAHA